MRTEDITLRESDDDTDISWVITHKPTGVTTQGRTRFHALLMLADALAAYYDADDDLLDLAEDVFVPDPDINIDSMFDDLDAE